MSTAIVTRFSVGSMSRAILRTPYNPEDAEAGWKGSHVPAASVAAENDDRHATEPAVSRDAQMIGIVSP